jgi:hypothetical protein
MSKKSRELKLGTPVDCAKRRLKITVHECLTSFAEVDAFKLTSRACYHCPEGKHLRERFANSGKDE